MPPIERCDGRRPPEALFVPETWGTVNRGKQRADDADAAARDDIELDARFVQRAQHAGMIRAGGPGSRQDEGRAKLRGVMIGGRRAHFRASAWVVSSLAGLELARPP